MPNAPQSSTGADAQPNPSTHLNFAPTVADPVAAHAQLPQLPVYSQVPNIRLQTPKSETLDKCTKFSVWAVDFLRKNGTDKTVSLNCLKKEFLQACPDCNGKGYEKISSQYVKMKSLKHAAFGEDDWTLPSSRAPLPRAAREAPRIIF